MLTVESAYQLRKSGLGLPPPPTWGKPKTRHVLLAGTLLLSRQLSGKIPSCRRMYPVSQ